MKLHRFHAATNQIAILMVQDQLGSNAFIYSTRKLANGVEILAGVPSTEEYEQELEKERERIQSPAEKNPSLKSAPTVSENDIERLKEQVNSLATTIASMADTIQRQCLDQSLVSEDDYFIRKNYLYYYLSKHGFRGPFCHQFIQSFLKARKTTENISEASIEKALRKFIKVVPEDLIATKRAIAMTGPTGAGKTTTIIKLAKRHLKKQPADSVALITTNYQDLVNKNYLLQYSEILGIDLEYANTPKELSLALTAMQDKKLILIDNAGYSQYDQKNITLLRSLLESQGGLLETYLVLPCNLQEGVIDEAIRSNITLNTEGCILTKHDECVSLAPIISTCMQYRLNIAYLCDGQDLNSDIHLTSAEAILEDIFRASLSKKQKLERNLKRNLQRVQRFQEETFEIEA